MKKTLSILAFLVCLLNITPAQTVEKPIYEKEDSLRFLKLRTKAIDEAWSKKKLNNCVILVGKSFLETPYIAHTLDKNPKERLVINLRELDCTTFVENCLALARCLQGKEKSWESYLAELQNIRYRNGILNEYPSRLHYFTDWIYDHQQRGIIKDLSKELGGESFPVNVFYMTKHNNKYPMFLADSNFIPLMKQYEQKINERPYYYIPKAKLPQVEKKIKSGDIIAITTNMEGLDIAHVGYALWIDGKLHFMHASSVGKKVMISSDSLFAYLNEIKHDTGIMIIRPQ